MLVFSGSHSGDCRNYLSFVFSYTVCCIFWQFLHGTQDICHYSMCWRFLQKEYNWSFVYNAQLKTSMSMNSIRTLSCKK